VTHAEFVRAYGEGAIRIDVDRTAAARFVSGRLLLPLVMLPVLGIGTALALTGWVWTGLSIIGLATLARIFIKVSSAHFVIAQSMQDEKFYGDAVSAGVFTVVAMPKSS
jgi:hypothetical protein